MPALVSNASGADKKHNNILQTRQSSVFVSTLISALMFGSPIGMRNKLYSLCTDKNSRALPNCLCNVGHKVFVVMAKKSQVASAIRLGNNVRTCNYKIY